MFPFIGIRQFAHDKQVCYFQERTIFGKIFDIVSPVKEYAVFAVYKCYIADRYTRIGKPRVIGYNPRFLAQGSNIHCPFISRAFVYRQIYNTFTYLKFGGAVKFNSVFHCNTLIII